MLIESEHSLASSFNTGINLFLGAGFSSLMRKVIYNFLENVPRSKICRFDIFKRKAFDADLMTRIFPYPDEGERFYEMCREIDDSPFLCQQCSLYLGRKHRFKEAFKWVERAKNRSNSFSVKNTQAIILFHANIDKGYEHSPDILAMLCESLDIIDDCYKNDRRKGYHARVLGELALKLYEEYGFENSEKYLVKAYAWLEAERNSTANSNKTRRDILKYHKEIKYILGY